MNDKEKEIKGAPTPESGEKEAEMALEEFKLMFIEIIENIKQDIVSLESRIYNLEGDEKMERQSIEEIAEWVKSSSAKMLSDGNLHHVIRCLDSIQNWYYDGTKPGGFISAVVQNNFVESCIRADSVNREILYLYAMFLYCELPGDWRSKAKKEFETH